MMKRFVFPLCLCLALGIGLLMTGCGAYSFTGASISPEVETVTVETFPNNADIVVPTLSQVFTEKMKDKFLRETRLNLVRRDGDLTFSGAIVDYRIAPASVQSGEQAAQNRVTISIDVVYENLYEPDQNFEQRFSNFRDFPANIDPNSVENEMIEEITEMIIQDIFNKSVNNW